MLPLAFDVVVVTTIGIAIPPAINRPLSPRR
jgi:hypothetical protein